MRNTLFHLHRNNNIELPNHFFLSFLRLDSSHPLNTKPKAKRSIDTKYDLSHPIQPITKNPPRTSPLISTQTRSKTKKTSPQSAGHMIDGQPKRRRRRKREGEREEASPARRVSRVAAAADEVGLEEKQPDWIGLPIAPFPTAEDAGKVETTGKKGRER